jgi:hypothetical protein
LGQKPAAEQAQASWPQRLRRAALFTLFALVLVVPKTLALRRRRGVWNVLRLVAALLGAFLVAAGRGPELGWLRPAAGLVLILLAVLVPPAEAEKSVDEQARELGALVVVNGGRFRVADGKLVLTRLFVASDRVHALDLKHRLLIEIPLAEVSSLRVEPRAGGWRLRLDWDQTTAEFSYDGFFAEHLARVAETTLLTQLRRELPVLKP